MKSAKKAKRPGGIVLPESEAQKEPESELAKFSEEALVTKSQNIRLMVDWVRLISSGEVLPFFYKQISSHLLSPDTQEFEMGIDTSDIKIPPNMVFQTAEITQNQNVIFSVTAKHAFR